MPDIWKRTAVAVCGIGSTARRDRAVSTRLGFASFLLGLISLVAPVGIAWAGLGSWSGGEGPPMDYASVVAVDPFDSQHLLVVNSSGLMQSRDGGATWSSAGLGSEILSAVAFHPNRRGGIYAGGYSAIYRTSDGGASWDSVELFSEIFDIAIDPRDGDRIYASLSTDCGICGPSFSRVSDDGGETWSVIGQEISGAAHFELQIDPADSDILYIGTDDAVWKSIDRGTTWVDVTPPESTEGWFDALLVTPGPIGGATVVYAGGGDGIFRSFDGGASWQRSDDGPTYARELGVSSSGALFAVSARGIYRSTDAGLSWEAVRPSAGSIDALALAIDLRASGAVYAGTWGDGLVRSGDGGESWTRIVTGSDFIAYTNALVAVPEVPAALYAVAQGAGVLRSIDGGRTWEPRNNGLTSHSVEALAVAPGDPQVLYAGSNSGVFRTDDGGVRWTARPFGLPQLGPGTSDVEALAVDRRNSDHVFAAGRYGVYRSLDGGSTWVQVLDLMGQSAMFAIDIDFDPHDPDHLVALSRTTAWQSSDGGDSWSSLDGVAQHANQLFDWTWDPVRAGRAWVASNGGVFRTVDGGETWLYANDGLCEPICGLPREIHWVSEGRLLVRDPNALWQSDNGGESWEPLDTGGLSSLALAVHPWSRDTVYLAGARGVYNRTELGCASPGTLCFQDQRFQLEIGWRDFEHRRGQARFVPFSSDASTVGWFFDPDNWEVLAKVVDGGDFDDHFWVFSGVASNVETVVRVTDTHSGRARSYHSPLGQTPETLAEIGVFPVEGPFADPLAVIEEVVTVAATPEPSLASGFDPAVVGQTCVATTRRACLVGGRFAVEVGWTDFLGRTGHARRVAEGTDDSSLWWFFGEQNWELLLKVLDGCGSNGHHWVFAAGTTNLGLDLRVTDHETGEWVELRTEAGQPMPTVTEIEALGGC